jgi:hypothetical protein
MKPRFSKREFRDAFRLHEQFRETKPTRARVIRAPKMPSVLMVMGTVEKIHYRTTHKGRAHLYRHDFAPGSRPMIAAGPKRNQLFLIGGRFHVTARGIVDLTAHGEEIEDAHGEDLPEES